MPAETKRTDRARTHLYSIQASLQSRYRERPHTQKHMHATLTPVLRTRMRVSARCERFRKLEKFSDLSLTRSTALEVNVQP